MSDASQNRFQDFFEEGNYLALKNHLYNYLLRKRAVEQQVDPAGKLTLEVGSGISPVMTKAERIVYSDLSWDGMAVMQRANPAGMYVVADGTKLPFKSGVFTTAITSEVLEHVEDDRKAISEIARVLAPQGTYVITFPHRQFYFAADDRFVHHYRRYELEEMNEKLVTAGLEPFFVKKVLGPIEKLTMFSIVSTFAFVQKLGMGASKRRDSTMLVKIAAPFFMFGNRLFAVIAWLDALIMPRALSTVLLVKARKE